MFLIQFINSVDKKKIKILHDTKYYFIFQLLRLLLLISKLRTYSDKFASIIKQIDIVKFNRFFGSSSFITKIRNIQDLIIVIILIYIETSEYEKIPTKEEIDRVIK